MKNLTITKQYPNFQTAHLYEHLFCSAVNKLFHDNELYANLDYFVRGTTYKNSGIIVVEIDTYTNNAEKLLSKIPTLVPDFSHETLRTGVLQLITEDSVVLQVSSDKIDEALQEVQQISWVKLDDLEYIDESKITTKIQPIQRTSESVKIRQVYIDFILDDDFAKGRDQLIPLFVRLSQYGVVFIADMLSQQFGCYHETTEYKRESNTLRVGLNIIDGQDIASEAISQSMMEHLKEVYSHATVQRFVSGLQSISYSNNLYGAPNAFSLLDDTGVLIGSKGWRNISTEDNVNAILKSISIKVKYGRKTISSKLSD